MQPLNCDSDDQILKAQLSAKSSFADERLVDQNVTLPLCFRGFFQDLFIFLLDTERDYKQAERHPIWFYLIIININTHLVLTLSYLGISESKRESNAPGKISSKRHSLD